MASINATLTTPASGTVVASVGDETTYVSLTVSRLGAVIKLTAGLTTPNAVHGYEEVGCELADDEDEAIEIATDLDYAALEKLVGLDVDYWRDGPDFAVALEKHFRDASRALTNDAYMVAAIEHNAALDAAE